MKAREFPVGYPVVLTKETLTQPPNAPLPWTQPRHNRYKGLLLVRVLPPQSMQGFPPLLGFRTSDGRLTFPLCAHCANNKQQQQCRHSIEKRSWVSGFTHVELNKALELGYMILDIFEVVFYINCIFFQYCDF